MAYKRAMLCVEQLPDDPMLLKQMLVVEYTERVARDATIAQHETALELCDLHIEKIRQEAAAALAQRDQELAQRDAAIAQREAQLEQAKREAAEHIEAMRQKHKAEIDALLRRFYGPRNERFDVSQLLLFGQMVDATPTQPEVSPTPRAQRRRHKHGRQICPEHLERIEVPHDLPEKKKLCPCCGKPRICIGTVVTEQLEHFPASVKVLKHVQFKYACSDCEQNGDNPQIELAPKPEQPINKGLPGPGLLAYLVTSKLADHLPLYRLERIFGRQGVHIASSTMCGWIVKTAELVAPLVLLMKQRIKLGKSIHSDETGVPVQAKGQCSKGRIWVYCGDKDHPYLVYEFSPDRTNQWPIAWLEGYQGFLQADAYAGYDAIYARSLIKEVGCWAHARRKFFDAKDTDSFRSAQILGMVQELYAIEARAKAASLSDDARRQMRQDESLPILARIHDWLLENKKTIVLTRGPMAEAINYALNQWDALRRYCDHGFLEIDNNAAERALKLIALGRKNYLFMGNEEFGQHYATLYSLIASAQRHGLNPQEYLTSIFQQIATMKLSDLEQFLPEVWKAQPRREERPGSPPAAGP